MTGDARPDPRRIVTRRDFGRELSLVKDHSGLSVRRLAQLVDVPASTLGGYLAGTHLPGLQPRDLLQRILEACGVTDPATLEAWRQAYWQVRRLSSGRADSVEGAAEPAGPARAPQVSAGIAPLPVSTRPPLGRLDGEPTVQGREGLLGELRTAIAESTHLSDLPRVRVLHGLGGCGKSTIALVIAREAIASNVRTWWITADDAASIASGMYSIAIELGASADHLRLGSLPDTLWQLLNALEEPWLLVLDNADDPPNTLALPGDRVTDGTGWLRPMGTSMGTVIVTTRDRSRATWGERRPRWLRLHGVDCLDDDQGARILRELTEDQAGGVADAKALSARLGGLPLALMLTGRYLSEVADIPAGLMTGGPVSDFAGYREALDHGGYDELATLVGTPKAREEHVTLGRTWELSLDLLGERGFPHARTLLQTLACLGRTPIPCELVLRADVLAESPLFAGISGRAVWESLRGLDGLGLVDLGRTGVDDSWLVTIHPVVRDMSRRQNGVRAQAGTYLALTTALLTPIVEETDPKLPSAWDRWQLLADHCAAPLGLIEEYRIEPQAAPPQAVDVAVRAAGYLRAAGQLARADAAYSRVLGVVRRMFAADDPRVLGLRHDLARLRHDQGQLEEAERLLRDVLRVRSDVLGPEHPDTLTTQHQLARTLRDRGRLDEAGTLFTRTLRARRRVLGEAHPDTLTSSNGVADVLRIQGRLAEARDAYKKVLAQRTAILGERHPATLVTRHYLADVRHGLDELEAAEEELRRLIDLNTELRGADHPRTLAVRQSLVHVLHDLGHLAEADELARELVQDRRRLLGDTHPATLLSRHRLGLIQFDRGAVDLAEQILQGVLIDRQRVLGLHHPNSVLSRETLAAVRRR